MNWRTKYLNQIVCGNCVEAMRQFPSGVIDLTVTSPPYDDLRDYDGHKFKFEPIVQELFRITKTGGVVVWVVGDQTINGSETGNSFRQALYFKEIGFRLHDTMIYQKSGFTSPQSTRYHQVSEYMFILVKGAPKTFNPLKDRKNVGEGRPYMTTMTMKRKMNGSLEPCYKEIPNRTIQDFGKRFNIWEYNPGFMLSTTDKIAFEHPAIFPEALAEDHILSWSNPGDLVLDPMVGSGTTCKMAKANGRHYIGIDIVPRYCEIAQIRLNSVQSKLSCFMETIET